MKNSKKYTQFIVSLFLMVFPLLLQAQINLGSGCNNNPDYTILQSSGTLYDSGGSAGQYTNNQLYRYTICNPDGCPMTISGTYDLENGYDFLEIVDGQNIYDGTSSGLAPNTILSSIYSGRYVRAKYTGGPGTIAGFTSTNNCITVLFKSDASVVDNGFQLNWASTCGTNGANPGDGLNGAGTYPNNGSGPSYDYCGTPYILNNTLGLDGTAAGPPATFNNVNATSGAGVGTNGCDPLATSVTGQSTLETTVYFQYCTDSNPGRFIDLGIDNGSGGAACAGYTIYQHANDGDGSGCILSTGFTKVTEGSGALTANATLPANTCWTIVADGLAGAECNFRAWFRVSELRCESTVNLIAPSAVCSGTPITWTAGTGCNITGTAGNGEVLDVFVYAPGGVPSFAPSGFENSLNVSSPTETFGSGTNDPQGIDDKNPTLVNVAYDRRCNSLPTAAALTNNTCSVRKVTYFAIIFDYGLDTDGDGRAEYDPLCGVKRYDVTIYPAAPTVTVVPGTCTTPSAAYLQVGSTTCDIDYGTIATALPCGTGNNTVTYNYEWTPAELAFLLTGNVANTTCYTSLSGAVTSTCAQQACPVICTPGLPDLITCP